VSAITTAELIRAAAYPKFGLSEADIGVLLAAYLPWTETAVTMAEEPAGFPHCRDKKDQEFLRLALAGRAEALVTGDKKLLELKGKVPFLIVTPAHLPGLIVS